VKNQVCNQSGISLGHEASGRDQALSRLSWVRGPLSWLPKGSTLPDQVWAQRHRRILLLLWLHIPGLFIFSLTQHLGVIHSLVEATVLAAFAFWATILRTNRRLSTVITALGLLTCSAVLVHVSGGVVEMHFHYFVMVGVVTLYQDWWPFLISIGYVVLQHGVAGAIVPASVYNHADAIAHPWRWAAIHGLFVVGMSGAGIASWRLNEVLVQEAADREEKLSEAQAVARLGSWDWDLASGGLTWSNELYRLFGVDPGGFTPSPEAVLSRVHAEDRDAVDADMRRTLEAGIPYARDFRIVLPEGTVQWVHGRGAVTARLDGRPTAMSGTLQDITERKRLEAELRHAQKLESVGQLAAGIAHEINTPIQFVGDNVRFLSDAFSDLSRVIDAYDEADGSPEPGAALARAREVAAEVDIGVLAREISEAIGETLEGVHRVTTIVRAMKAFGHPSGENKALADLNEAVRNTLVVASNEVKYVAETVSDLGDLPLVSCHLGDINQVLLNLVVNAAHAVAAKVGDSGQRGTITVRTRHEGEDVVVEVSDTGAGIPPQIAERVFEPFFTTKEVGKGTGQGLALAYSLVVDRHGGSIGFHSPPGGGTTFTLRLPVGVSATELEALEVMV
jgi:PAS domain S-box-containing protein